MVYPQPVNAQPSGPWDRLWAAALVAAMHLLLLAWLVDRAGQGNVGLSAERDGSGAGMAVTFVALPPSPQPAADRRKLTPDQAPREHDNASEAMRSALTKADPLLADADTGVQASRPSTLQALADVEQAARAASVEPSGGFTGDDKRASYHAALRAAIQRKWQQLAERKFPSGCELQLALGVGGAVNATTASACNLSTEERQQLEAAALMAQPLPYGGFEDVFSPDVLLTL